MVSHLRFPRRLALLAFFFVLSACASSSLQRQQLETLVRGSAAGCPVTPAVGQAGRKLRKEGGSNIFVTPETPDPSADGSADNPYGSLETALKTAVPGDRVWLRGGTFEKAKVRIRAKGEAGRPIVISAYPGEHVVFDGETAPIENSDCNLSKLDNTVIFVEDSAHLILDGLEVKGSAGCGVSISESQNITVRNFEIHQIWSRALGGAGKDLVFEGNHIHDAVLQNEGESAKAQNAGFWSSATGTWVRKDGSYSKNITWRNNRVHDSWGECISARLVDGARVEGNRIDDCYNAGIYVNHSRAVSVDRNVVRMRSAKYRRTDQDRLAVGVLLATEQFSAAPNLLLEKITVTNNLVDGAGIGLAYWHDPRNGDKEHTYRDVVVAHNVFRASEDRPVRIAAVGPGFEAPSGGRMVNNVLLPGGKDADPAIGEPKAWTVKANLNKDPGFGSEEGPEPIGYAATAIPALESEAYHGGEPEKAAPKDFACRKRDPKKPSVGIFE